MGGSYFSEPGDPDYGLQSWTRASESSSSGNDDSGSTESSGSAPAADSTPVASTGNDSADSGSTDTAQSDSGSTDSGSIDSGSTDTGSIDTGSTDTGQSDSSSNDSSSYDSSSYDSSSDDSGSNDSGSADAGSSGSGSSFSLVSFIKSFLTSSDEVNALVKDVKDNSSGADAEKAKVLDIAAGPTEKERLEAAVQKVQQGQRSNYEKPVQNILGTPGGVQNLVQDADGGYSEVGNSEENKLSIQFIAAAARGKADAEAQKKEHLGAAADNPTLASLHPDSGENPLGFGAEPAETKFVAHVIDTVADHAIQQEVKHNPAVKGVVEDFVKVGFERIAPKMMKESEHLKKDPRANNEAEYQALKRKDLDDARDERNRRWQESLDKAARGGAAAAAGLVGDDDSDGDKTPGRS